MPSQHRLNRPAAKPTQARRSNASDAPQTDTLQRAVADPAAASPKDLLNLQRTLGNRAVSRLAGSSAAPPRRPRVQTKLTVGPAGDSYEQEADRVAESVLRMPAQDTPPLAESDSGQTPVRRASDAPGFEAGPHIEQRLTANAGRGQPLTDSTRTGMEARFGADFGAVRVHTGGEADQLNRSMSAQAFTYGRDIYFGGGKYNPGTTGGNRLLAHELTHVVQQNGTANGPVRTKPSGARVQRLVDRAALVARAGKQKGMLFFRGKKEKAYASVLDWLDTYHNYIRTVTVRAGLQSPQAFKGMASVFLAGTRLAAQRFMENAGNDPRGAHMQGVLDGIQIEREALQKVASNLTNYDGQTYAQALNAAKRERIRELQTEVEGLTDQSAKTGEDLREVWEDDTLDKSEQRSRANELMEQDDELKGQTSTASKGMLNILDQNPDLLEGSNLGELNQIFNTVGFTTPAEEQGDVQPKLARLRAHDKMRENIKQIIQRQIGRVMGRLAGVAKFLRPGWTRRSFKTADFVDLMEPEDDLASMLAQMNADRVRSGLPEDEWMNQAVLDSKGRTEFAFQHLAEMYPNPPQVPAEIDKLKVVKGNVRQMVRKGMTQQHDTLKEAINKTDAKIQDVEPEVRDGGAMAPLEEAMRVIKAFLITGNEYQPVLTQVQGISSRIMSAKVANLNERSKSLTPSEKKFRNKHQGHIIDETTKFLARIGGGKDNLFKLPEGEERHVAPELVPSKEDFNVKPLKGMTSPGKLSEEQRAFLAGKVEAMTAEQAYERGFVTRYHDDPKHFHKMMQFGKVLWTLDVKGRLSIGSERSENKHAIVAGGQDVWGAGEARIKRVADLLVERGDFTARDLSLVSNIDEYEAGIAKYRDQAEKGVLPQSDAQIVIGQNQEYIDQITEELGGVERVLEIRRAIQSGEEELGGDEQTVVLDFGSGHYTPSGAWRKANDAWSAAGFKVEWNVHSQFV